MKHWINAARLRTLPLSVSGIIVGSVYHLVYQSNLINNHFEIFNWEIFLFAILTTLSLQVLSNFANDYGDGLKGTDNNHRIGPQRALQSGKISPKAMKKAIIITTIITFIFAVLLIYFTFGFNNFNYALFFLILSIISIVAAVRYTVGNYAYGYYGYGDFFVFIFFGLVSTIGVNFLYSQQIDCILFLPAVAIGFLSVGVLNLNNMRDEISDKKVKKNTLVVKMGLMYAKVYHFFLIILALILIFLFAILKKFHFYQYSFLVVYIPLIFHLKTVYLNKDPVKLDPELKKLAIATFALAVLICICMILIL